MHSSRAPSVNRNRIDPWPVALAVVLAGLLIALLPRPLSSDISGQLWLAQQIRQGARLYVDLVEINPPLWFWMAVPVQVSAAATGLQADGLLIAAVAVAALAALVATDRLTRHLAPTPRRTFLLYAALILFVMPIRDFGQREQLALFAALPYAALVAVRRRGDPAGVLLAILVGAGGALGFALKHYFLVAPILLELWLLLGLRRDWRPVRPETLALAAVGVAYGAAILIATPEYLTEMAPRLRLAYGIGAPTPRQMILPAQLVWLLTLVAIGPNLRLLCGAGGSLPAALLIAAAGFVAAWLIQHKGWPYQSIPATGLFALGFAALLLERWQAIGGLVRKLAPAVVLLPIALALTPTHAPITPETDIAPALAGLPPGASVAIVSTEGNTYWPSAVNRGLRFPSRYGSLWMLPAIDAHPDDPRVQAFGREVIRQTVIDFRCLPPARIVFVRPDRSDDATAAADPLRFFLRDPGFAGLMTHYVRWRQAGVYDAYRLASPLVPVPGAACRRGA